MKQKQIGEYRPRYPKKLLKGAILTTAAAVALTGTTGCKAKQQSASPADVPATEQPEELVLDGEIAIDPQDDPELLGEPIPDDFYDMEDDPEGSGRDEPALMGKITVPEENP